MMSLVIAVVVTVWTYASILSTVFTLWFGFAAMCRWICGKFRKKK